MEKKILELINLYKGQINELVKLIEEGGDCYDNQEPVRIEIETLKNVVSSLEEVING